MSKIKEYIMNNDELLDSVEFNSNYHANMQEFNYWRSINDAADYILVRGRNSVFNDLEDVLLSKERLIYGSH